MPTDMKGSLSRNPKRETDRHPEFRGSCMVAGVEYWLSAWVREGDDGSKYFSLSFREKEPKPETRETRPAADGNTQRPAYSPRKLDDDSIPFAPEWR